MHVKSCDVGGSNMETVESASGLFRVVRPAVELHTSASIDEANGFVVFFFSLFQFPHHNRHTLNSVVASREISSPFSPFDFIGPVGRNVIHRCT